MLIVWTIRPDEDTSYNADKLAISTYALGQYKPQVYAITVGSETLYRGNFTGDQLLAKINDVKNMAKGIKVGTADSWNKYADGTADAVIKGNPDIL
jgi:glucan 1,3-beta-glucosidase